MDALNALVGNYTVESVLFVVVAVVLLARVLGQAVEWIWDRLVRKVRKSDGESSEHRELSESISAIRSQLDAIGGDFVGIHEQLAKTDAGLESMQEHLLQITRAYFIEQYYHFCHDKKMIDDNSMQILELRYSFYKAHGGNSYVDNLMAELRELPRVSVEDPKVVSAIRDKGVFDE